MDLNTIKEKFLNSYTSEASNFFKLYTDMYAEFPMEFCIGLSRESYIDIEKLEKKDLDELYPNSLISIVKVQASLAPTSCVDEIIEEDEEEEEEEEDYASDYWMMGRHWRPSVTIVCPDKKLMLRMGVDGIAFYHAPGFDCIAEKERLLKALPHIEVKTNESHRGKVELVCNDGDGYYTIESRIAKVDIDIDKHYNDDFKPVYNEIKKFLDPKNRKSGIVILNGMPGTGKTTLIRHIVSEFPGRYIFINNSMGMRLNQPEFITFLMEHKDSIFILEDCEAVVMDRQLTGFNNAVAAILNMADGIMSDIFNGKFICTFNTDISKVDQALLRRGRCYGNYEFKKLEAKKAKVLLEERGYDVDKCDDMTLADIYNYENTIVEETQKSKAIGFTNG